MSAIDLINKLKNVGIQVQLLEGRLKISAPEGSLTPHLVEELKEHKEEIIEFLRSFSKKDEYVAIEPVEKREYYPLSSPQKRMYFLQQMEPGSTVYNMLQVVKLAGSLDIAKLEDVFHRLILRHESLRTSFHLVGEQPVQRVQNNPEFALQYFETAGTGEPGNTVEKIIKGFSRQFDLSKAPLLRVGLVKLSDTEFILMVDMHHIIIDGVSFRVPIEEFMDLYAGREPPPLRIFYKDYACWQEAHKDLLKDQEDYWLGEFREESPPLRLPADFPRSRAQDFAGSTLRFEANKEETRALKKLAAAGDTTLFTVLLAIFNIFLAKLSGQPDIVIGTPVAGRRHADTGRILGMFVNTLALRNYPTADKSFDRFLDEVKERTLAAFENQEYPFEDLVAKVVPGREAGRNPLFDVMFALQNIETAKLEIPGLKLLPYKKKSEVSKFDLSLGCGEAENRILFHFEYCTEIFKKETIERFIKYFKSILASVIANPGLSTAEVDILDEAEKQRLLVDFNDTKADYPRDKSIRRLFAEQVEQSPHSAAVTGSSVLTGGVGPASPHLVTLTYKELDERAGRMARFLSSRGVEGETIVAILAERSVETAAAILAILKAGGAYLPIDPAYPAQRITYMLEDSAARLLLTTRSLRQETGGPGKSEIETVLIDSPTREDEIDKSFDQTFSKVWPPAGPPEAKNNNLAYVIYTSGTTGQPKGIAIEQGSVVNLLSWFSATFGVGTGTRVLQLTDYSFDPSIEDIFGSLLFGATLFTGSKELTVQVEDFCSFVDAHRIHVVNFIPTLLKELLCHERELKSLRVVIAGGEKMTEEVKDSILERGYDLFNHYGPTEITVDALSGVCSAEKVNLGKPLANVRCYILDPREKPVPTGAVGELYIAGPGLARGYLNNPELTAEKFMTIQLNKSFLGGRGGRFFKKAPLAAGGNKIYKTGDLCRWLPDGRIEFVGRVDHQVKIRGYRIELGEIENRLQAHPGVEEAAAAVKESGETKTLCGYYVDKVSRQPELFPSIGEYPLYDDLIYYAMTSDELRTRSYRNAIDRLVKDKTVVEIGTGQDAILARFCVEAGARKVYAIELSEEGFRKAGELIEKTGLQDKIILIKGNSLEVQLPEKVDVCVSEIIGTIGSSEGVVPILNDAWRFLKEDGIMIPHKCITMIAAVSLPERLYRQPGFSEVGARYVEKLFDYFGYPFDFRICLRRFPKSALISGDDIFEELDFSRAAAAQGSREIELLIKRDSELDGFLLWINLHTCRHKNKDEIIDTLADEYSWLPVFVPLPVLKLAVKAGDKIKAVCRVSLSANKINPDYSITGVIHRQQAEDVTFECDLPYDEKSFQKSPFYREFFDEKAENYIRRVNKKLSPGELRSYLEKKLPDYMIPSFIIPMEKIPLDPNGKVDRRALPRPETVTAGSSAPPRDEIETALTAAWQEVLGVNRIGINDNFFELGGDSIKAIQAAARLKKYRLNLRINDLFMFPTVAELAKNLRKDETFRAIDQGVVSGTVPLTPIQHDFFHRGLTDNFHFNHAVLLYRESGIDEAVVRELFTEIATRHDALRMVYRPGEKGGLEQWNRGVEEPLFELHSFDLRDKPARQAKEEIQQQSGKVQRSMNLEKGPLLKLGLFKTAQGDYLAIIVHHLVVDGVSWRILLEDAAEGFEQLQAGGEIHLPGKTHSFLYWAHQQAAHAESEVLLNELEYWRTVEETVVDEIPLKKDSPPHRCTFACSESIAVQLEKKETQALLRDVNRAYGTEINDILLTALGLALKKWAGIEKIALSLEGHGREEIVPGIDIGRTIGWFTTQYPVILDLARSDEISYSLKQIKETLRKVPNKGIGYGILKYLTPANLKKGIQFVLEPRVSFNYLGQFDRGTGGGIFEFSGIGTGENISSQMERTHVLDINGAAAGGNLTLTIDYSRHELDKPAVEELAGYFRFYLLEIIRHCAGKEEKELTPADMDYAGGLSIEQLDELEDSFADMDID